MDPVHIRYADRADDFGDISFAENIWRWCYFNALEISFIHLNSVC